MPAENVDLKHVAENVGHTSRATCGKCHFNGGGGGEAVKHADLSRQLRNPERNCDIHMGDPVDLDAAVVHLTEPVGSISDPNSKISPFKIMKGIQAVDARHRYILVPHLFPRDENDKTVYWVHRDWQKAFTDGMQAVGLPYSGEYVWKETWMHWGLNHEVMPAKMALSCVQCHSSLQGERTCNRCHQDNREVDFTQIAHKDTDFSYMLSKGRDVAHLGQPDRLHRF